MTPPAFSEASHTRRQIAAALSQALAPYTTGEMCITGSVARGTSDRFSDIELRTLVDQLAEPAVYEEQLRAAGARVDPVSDYWQGTITTKSWYRGVFIEAAWQTWDGLTHQLEPVLKLEKRETRTDD